MKVNKLNKVKIILLFTFVLTFIGCSSRVFTEKDEYINLQMLMIDSNNEIIKNSIEINSGSNNFSNNVLIALDSNIDKEFDAILLCNYKQVTFSINDLEASSVQVILLNKTDGLVRNKFLLTFDGLSPGLNDCILILIEKMSSNNDSNLIYTMRFTVTCNAYGNKQLHLNSNKNIAHAIENRINNIELNDDMVILDSDLQVLNSIKSVSQAYILIDLESTILQTNFSNGYMNDKFNPNTNINIGIFAIGDNKQLLELNQSNIHLIQSQLDSKIIAEIDLSQIDKDIKKISFFAVSYPLERQNEMAGTYKRVFWNTILSKSIYSY